MKAKRAFCQLRELPDNIDETRTVQFIISSERRDRHGTVLSLDGWDLDSYHRNPIVGYQHDVYGDSFLQSPNPDSVIGKGRVFREANYLVAEVEFEPAEINSLADKVFKKVKFGTLRSASVGFLPLEKGRWGKEDEARDGKNPTFYFGKRELLEFSIVNIPSNSDAVRRQLEDDILEEETEPEVKEEPQEELKDIKDTQKPTHVPDHEKLRIRFELTKIV